MSPVLASRDEGARVDVDRVRVERDGLARHREARWIGRGQRSAKSEEGFPKPAPGLGKRPVTPEQRCQLVSGVRHPGGHGEVGEQRLGLPGPQAHGRPGPDPGLKIAHEREAESHRARAPVVSQDRVPPSVANPEAMSTDLQRPRSESPAWRRDGIGHGAGGPLPGHRTASP